MTATTVPERGQESETFYVTTYGKMELTNFPKKYPWMYVSGLGYGPEPDYKIVDIDDVKKPPEGITPIGTYAHC